MIEINLAPDIKQELIRAQRIRTKVIAGSILIGMASVGVVVSLALYVFGVQSVRSGLADMSIDSESAKFLNVTDLSKTLTIQNQLTKISEINNSKKIDSRIFDVLAAIIPPSPNEVKISNLLINADTNTINLEGQAANSFAAVEVFRKTIEGAQVKYKVNTDDEDYLMVPLAYDISTSNTSYGEDSTGAKVLRFTISFKYETELFSPLSKDLSIVVTINGNATDSYLGLPKSIFVDRAKDIEGEDL